MRKCYLCGGRTFSRVEGKVRDMPRMPILRCVNCGLIALADFGHIDDKFYSESRMLQNDPHPDWKRYLTDCAPDDSRRAKWMRPRLRGKSVLDVGCGGGGFLQRIKAVSRACAGVEKDDVFRRRAEKAWRIRIHPDVDAVRERFDFVTLFHVLEHLKDPREMLARLERLLNPGGKIMIEVPNADDALLSVYACKAFSEFTHWKCHLYLYNEATLTRLLRSAGLRVESITQVQRFPLSNHLYWLANGKPGGHRIWGKLDSASLSREYEKRLGGLRACDTIIACAGMPKR